MIGKHVDILLSVWERVNAPLAECRRVLEAKGWDEASAVAHLRADVGTKAGAGDTEAKALLGHFKELAREHRDVTIGTLPRCLVFATEPQPGGMRRTEGWNRHRYFLGAPIMRWFGRPRGDAGWRGPLSLGGIVRIARDLEQAPHAPATAAEEASLAHHDAAWVLDRLAYFAQCSGRRVAVELRGSVGWVDGDGAESAIAAACARILDDATATAIDRTQAWELLDRYPDRRTGVKDCGWAPSIEAALLLAARLLRDVELTSNPGPALDDLRVAVTGTTGAGVPFLLAARESHHVTGGATFPDVLDRVLLEHDASTVGPGWREVTRDEAVATWRGALTKSQAYGSALLPAEQAAKLVDAFVGSFDDDALFFRNGTDTGYHPVMGCTFELGAGVIDTSKAGILFIGDED